MAFLAVNAALILVAAAFSSTPAGLDHLHDRYLFYVVPLWLAVLGRVARGRPPRPVLATAVGVGLALVLPALVPFEKIAAEDGVEVDAVVTYLWSQVNATAFESFPDAVSGRRVLALFVVLLVGAVLLVPRRFGLGLVAVVVGVSSPRPRSRGGTRFARPTTSRRRCPATAGGWTTRSGTGRR